ncbi:MAG: ABC transporter ATP-binding protein [Oligoflexia bacterium]|nr:ABC transporter ATP-binding protein [Oligoflexia bacterium]
MSIGYFKKLWKTILHNVSFDIFKGEIIGLLGVNGAGRTTLSSIIGTVKAATSGDILWNGRSVYSQLIEYRRILGFCPQIPNLDLGITVQQSLLFAGRFFCLSERDVLQRRAELIKEFGLEKYVDALPSALSGGYKQRFLIARTLMHRPKLVILDEPTVGLDPHIRQHLWEVIRRLRDGGVTVLLTTHYLDEAEILSDRVCVLDAGKILVLDTPENLKRNYQKDKLEDVFLHLVASLAETTVTTATTAIPALSTTSATPEMVEEEVVL